MHLTRSLAGHQEARAPRATSEAGPHTRAHHASVRVARTAALQPPTSDAGGERRPSPAPLSDRPRIVGSHDPSSASTHLLERIPQLRETFYLLRYRFIMKGYNRNGQGGEAHRARRGEKAAPPPTSPHGHWFPEPHPLGVSRRLYYQVVSD